MSCSNTICAALNAGGFLSGLRCRSKSIYDVEGVGYCRVHAIGKENKKLIEENPSATPLFAGIVTLSEKNKIRDFITVKTQSRIKGENNYPSLYIGSPYPVGLYKDKNLKAHNIKNFMHAHALYPFEMDHKGCPLPCFYETLERIYGKVAPMKEKHSAKIRRYYASRYAPVAYVFYNVRGEEVRYTPKEAIYIFSKFYQKMVEESDEFAELLELYKNGSNLNIVCEDLDSEGFVPQRLLFALLSKEGEKKYYVPFNEAAYANMF